MNVIRQPIGLRPAVTAEGEGKGMEILPMIFGPSALLLSVLHWVEVFVPRWRRPMEWRGSGTQVGTLGRVAIAGCLTAWGAFAAFSEFGPPWFLLFMALAFFASGLLGFVASYGDEHAWFPKPDRRTFKHLGERSISAPDASDPWYVRLPDGRTFQIGGTQAVRQLVEAGEIPPGSWVRRWPDEEWVSLDWAEEFADLVSASSR